MSAVDVPVGASSPRRRVTNGDRLGRDPELRRRLHRRVDGIGAAMAGGANVAIQLAWPPVARGVLESPVHSGSVFRHPVKRARTTLTYLAVAMYGDDDTCEAFREAVNGSHRQVRSAPGASVRYNAFDRELQLWVASCLYFGARDLAQRMHGELDAAHEDELFEMGRRFGSTLQVPDEEWHADVAAFEDYWARGLALAHMDDETRRMLRGLLSTRGLVPFPLTWVVSPLLEFVNVGFLPPAVRDLLGYAWSPTQELWHSTAVRWLGALSRPLPDAVRAFPFNVLLLDVRLRRRLGRALV